jgi:trehalose 6-phosphate phosphatase
MMEAREPEAPIEELLGRVAAAPMSALLLDFDGTLAPFRVDPASVRPWVGVRQLLERIQATGRTRITVVTGRPARETVTLLGMVPPPEVWGLHGAERLGENGKLEQEMLSPECSSFLEKTWEMLQSAELGRGVRIERKWNAIAVHWRGASASRARTALARTIELFHRADEIAGMGAAQFDGGVELRAGRNKGDAVRLILKGMPAGVPVAYLGDDATDEDAFRALDEQGLAILVRREVRPSAAHLWLRPPGELLGFLAAWLGALGDMPTWRNLAHRNLCWLKPAGAGGKPEENPTRARTNVVQVSHTDATFEAQVSHTDATF